MDVRYATSVRDVADWNGVAAGPDSTPANRAIVQHFTLPPFTRKDGAFSGKISIERAVDDYNARMVELEQRANELELKRVGRRVLAFFEQISSEEWGPAAMKSALLEADADLSHFKEGSDITVSDIKSLQRIETVLMDQFGMLPDLEAFGDLSIAERAAENQDMPSATSALLTKSQRPAEC